MTSRLRPIVRAPMRARHLLPFALLAACGDGTGPASRGTPGFTILSGADVSDTIEATLREPLVVQLRDSTGRPRRGVVVRFLPTIRTSPDDPTLRAPTMLTVRASDGRVVAYMVDTTDAQGRASTLAWFLHRAGPAGLELEALGFRDTASYTIRPGAPVAVQIATVDTTVLAGGSVQLRGAVVDRAGNPRPEALQWRVLGGEATVTSNGVVSTRGAGVATVEASAGSLADTTRVGSIPDGVLSGFRFGGSGAELVLFRTDGTQPRVVQQVSGADLGRDLAIGAWNAAAAVQLFQLEDFPRGTRIWLADTVGGRRRLTASDDATFHETWPHATADGAWVYFTNVPSGSTTADVWRARPGGAPERVVTSRPPSATDAHPAPSPDGRHLLFASNRADGSSTFRLFVLELASGTVTPIGVEGFVPRWSPSGTTIAYLRGNQLRTIAANGSGDRLVHDGVLFPYAWSPDGAWIVAPMATGTGLGLRYVHVASGLSTIVPTPVRAPLAWVR